MTRVLKHLTDIVSESLHGGLWQTASFASRLLFLVLVMPFLPSGELASYVFATSIAVLVARLLLLGLDDELPLVVRADYARAKQLFPIVVFVWMLLPLIVGAGVVSGSWLPYALLLGTTGATGLYLSGVVRTLSPADFERLQNLQWVLFGLLAVTQLFSTAESLIVLRSVCALSTQLLIVFKQRLFSLPSWQSMSKLLAELWDNAQHSWYKLASNLSLVGAMRGYILWPAALATGPRLDTVAFAVACGEALWQMGMVFAHRRYARFSELRDAVVGEGRSVIASAFVLVGAFSLVVLLGIWAVEYLGLFPSAHSSRMVAEAALFYIFLAGFCLLRFLLWSLRKFEWTVIGILIAIISVQGAIVYFFEPDKWFPIATVACMLALMVISGLVFHATRGAAQRSGVSSRTV
ncbi:MAG: hypothetical protein ACR2QQ_06110 [Gammaproteobacteria bacterium]